MNHLLFTDPHFTDAYVDDYRWELFPFLIKVAKENNVDYIHCLGDLVNTKDRHSSDLVNFLVDQFVNLRNQTHTEVDILAGNHDKPLKEPYFWEFLNKAGITYIIKPMADPRGIILYLPFSSNAVNEWKDWLQVKDIEVIFMHQTLEGAIVEDGRRIPSNPYPIPPLPAVPIYSGDVHHPQTIGNLVYVGAPYPVRFGENWNHRIILIKDDDFKHPISIPVPSIQRAIIDLDSADGINNLTFKEKDQIKIRYKLDANSLTSYSEAEVKIRHWAQQKGIHILSMEPTLVGESKTTDSKAVSELLPPKEVIRSFVEKEKLSEEVANMGYQILNESL